MDWNKLNGSDSRRRIPDLQNAIMSPDYNFGLLINIFLPATGGGGGSKAAGRGRK